MEELPTFATILDTLEESAAVLDHAGVIVAVNESWRTICRNAGGDSSCFVGREYLAFCGEAPDAVRNRLEQVIGGDERDAVVDYVMRIGSQDTWFRLRAAWTGDGKFVVLRHTDVTTEMTAVADAERVQQRYRNLFESNQAGVIISTFTGVVLQANPAAAHIYGFSTVEQFKQHNAREFWTQPEAREALLQTLIAGNRVSSLPVEVTTPAGRKSLLISAQLIAPESDLLIETTVVDITRWRTVEHRLRTNEEWFRKVLLKSPVEAFSQDLDLRYRWIYNSLMELGETDVVGRTDHDLYPPSTASRLVEVKREVIATRGAVREVIAVETSAGVKYLDLSLEPDLQDGAVVGINGAGVDVTARVHAEQALREREASLRGVMDFASEAVVLADEDGVITYANERACKLFQRKREQIVGDSLSNLIASHSRDPGEFPWRQWMSGRAVVAELIVARGDGSEIVTEISAIRLPDGRLQAFIRDTTERHRVESERQLMASIVNSSDAAIMSTSPDWTVMSWNPSAERMFGWTSAEMIGAPLSRVVPQWRMAELDAIRSAFTEGTSLDRYRTIRQRHDGSLLEVELTAWPVRDHRGQIERVCAIARDISQQMVEERERKALEQRVERAERIASLGRLAATIAHEFNNVMMGIGPFVELLRNNGDDPGRRESMLLQIENALTRGKRITSEILRYARPHELDTTPMQVSSWLDSVAPQLALLVPGVALEWRRAADELWLQADRQQLDQVLTNLVINAKDAAGPSGTIEVIAANANPALLERQGISTLHGGLHLVVRDDGPGITPADLPRIFEPLFSTKRGGTGLGLPLAFQVVQAHGGVIWAESEPGRGTELHVLLPAIPRLHREVAAEQRESPTLPDLNVLLVEDDDDVAVGLEGLLDLLGLRTTRASDGHGALAEFRAGRFDLAILDVGLPDLDGAELASMLRDRDPALPILFSTGHATSAEATAGLGSRTGTLMKPYGLDELRHAIVQITSGS